MEFIRFSLIFFVFRRFSRTFTTIIFIKKIDILIQTIMTDSIIIKVIEITIEITDSLITKPIKNQMLILGKINSIKKILVMIIEQMYQINLIRIRILKSRLNIMIIKKNY